MRIDRENLYGGKVLFFLGHRLRVDAWLDSVLIVPPPLMEVIRKLTLPFVEWVSGTHTLFIEVTAH